MIRNVVLCKNGLMASCSVLLWELCYSEHLKENKHNNAKLENQVKQSEKLIYFTSNLSNNPHLEQTGINASMPNKQPQASALMIFSNYFKAPHLFRVTEETGGDQSTSEYCHVTILSRISIPSLKQCHYHDLIDISLTIHSREDRVIQAHLSFSQIISWEGQFWKQTEC